MQLFCGQNQKCRFTQHRRCADLPNGFVAWPRKREYYASSEALQRTSPRNFSCSEGGGHVLSVAHSLKKCVHLFQGKNAHWRCNSRGFLKMLKPLGMLSISNDATRSREAMDSDDTVYLTRSTCLNVFFNMGRAGRWMVKIGPI